MSDSTVRAFVAVQIPEEVSEAVWQVQDALQAYPAMRGLRWVEPDDSHITLKFLGETPIPQLPAIVEALDGVAERMEPFTVRLGLLGAFPNVNRPNNIWLGVEEGERPFQRLFNGVEVALKRLGIKPERGEFHPHLTLARVPRSWSAEQQSAVGNLIGAVELPEVPPFTVSAIALIRSLLTPGESPQYMRLGNSILGEAPPLAEDEWEDEPDDDDFE
jgi:RNA 2',3'-cyclic 3'-phosphodiesterase